MTGIYTQLCVRVGHTHEAQRRQPALEGPLFSRDTLLESNLNMSQSWQNMGWLWKWGLCRITGRAEFPSLGIHQAMQDSPACWPWDVGHKASPRSSPTT